ncbi:hypothetical protein SASC598O02_013800 [Snodgrassella alvi SCGC AB-598-O02]|nr:hypothetical protein SASC598O02_013800 [Snodgrassella alvi SCGC AB-598-O02]
MCRYAGRIGLSVCKIFNQFLMVDFIKSIDINLSGW